MNPGNQESPMRDRTKRDLYTTAQATIGCAHFPEGAFVGVRYVGPGCGGVHWYDVILDSVSGKAVCQYPEHHLTRMAF